MPEITITLNAAGLTALAGQYRRDRDDGPLTDRQKARRVLVKYCRDLEHRVRQRAAKNAPKIDENSAI